MIGEVMKDSLFVQFQQSPSVLLPNTFFFHLTTTVPLALIEHCDWVLGLRHCFALRTYIMSGSRTESTLFRWHVELV